MEYTIRYVTTGVADLSWVTSISNQVWKKESTDEVAIEIFEKEMQAKVSANDIDRSHWLGKNRLGVDLGLLSSNLSGTMSVMQFLEKRRSWKLRLLV